VRFLIDTNVFFEMLFDRPGAGEAKRLLENVEQHEFFISDYALHSVGTYLFQRNQINVFRQFLKDQIVDAGMNILTLSAEDLERVAIISEQTKLDFDDAYQYTVAEKYDLTLVSFDKDFDRTSRGRKTPAAALKIKDSLRAL